MIEMNSTHQRESGESCDFYGESNEGSYENNKSKILPEGYTAYKEIGQVIDPVYDRYSSDYGTSSMQEEKMCFITRKCPCRDIGGLLICRNMLGHLIT